MRRKKYVLVEVKEKSSAGLGGFIIAGAIIAVMVGSITDATDHDKKQVKLLAKISLGIILVIVAAVIVTTIVA